MRLGAARDGNVEAEKRADALQFGVAGSGEFEAEDFAALGCIGGWMNGAGAPLDEKGKKAGLIVVNDSGALLDERDAFIEVARAKKDPASQILNRGSRS